MDSTQLLVSLEALAALREYPATGGEGGESTEVGVDVETLLVVVEYC